MYSVELLMEQSHVLLLMKQYLIPEEHELMESNFIWVTHP